MSTIESGATTREYDTNADGKVDFAEVLSPTGLVTALRWPGPDRAADVAWPPPVDGSVRHLLIIVDSVPYALVQEAWNQGRFRYFQPPVRVLAPFPVMTDVSLGDFFHVLPATGMESQYFDGRRLNNGLFNYLGERNSAWVEQVDYHLLYLFHLEAYLHPDAWYADELRHIQTLFNQQPAGMTSTYVVSTSALGAQQGRAGHQAGLVRLDRFCQQIIHDAGGRVHLTLLSDHGHNLQPSRRVDLRAVLRRCGYHVGQRCARPADVAIPLFGVITCAALYTPSSATLAGDLVGLEGLALAMYRTPDDAVAVLSRDGCARIERRAPLDPSAGRATQEEAYRYTAERGDPLNLRPVWADLASRGLVDADGFVADSVLFAATADHVYPDGVRRVWRAFHGLMVHTPDVLVSVENGYYCGDETFAGAIDLSGAHGSLDAQSTTGFCLTTAGGLPRTVRMEDLAAALRACGVPLESAPGTEPLNLPVPRGQPAAAQRQQP